MRHPKPLHRPHLATLLGASLGLCLLLPVTARAGEIDGKAILADVERHLETPTDSFVRMRMTITDPSGKTKVREATIKQKGNEKRLFKFLSPADMKGVGVLALENDVMYVYMPAFKKVKRLATSAKTDKFMGSDFTYEDMGEMSFTDNYEVTGARMDGDDIVLTLVPKKASSAWDHLEMWVRKSDHAHTRIDYYGKKSGKKERTLLRSKLHENEDGKTVADEMLLKDLLRGSSTKIEVLESKTNNGFSDREFSQRYLKRR